MRKIWRERKLIRELGIPSEIVAKLRVEPSDTGYLIEPDTLRLARLYAQFYMERYQFRHPTIPQLGMGISQAIFEIILQDMKAPYVHNQPVIDRRKGESGREIIHWDFWVPGLGAVEIKSQFPQTHWKSKQLYYPTSFNINVAEWERERPDWIVGMYILDMPQAVPESFEAVARKVWLVGYMDRATVESYDIRPGKPRYPGDIADRRYRSIPIRDIQKHEWQEFEAKLKQVARELANWRLRGDADA